MGGLLGQHRDDARLAVAGAVLFAASYLLMHAVGMNFELPKAAPPSISGTAPASRNSERPNCGYLEPGSSRDSIGADPAPVALDTFLLGSTHVTVCAANGRAPGAAGTFRRLTH